MRHQQTALEYISGRLGHLALVAYGCAAFHTLDALYRHIETNTLSVNSSFVRATRLSGHNEWAYDRPGMVGVACSEIEHVKEAGLFEQLAKLKHDIVKSDESEDLQAKKALAHLNKVSNLLMETMDEISKKEYPLAIEFVKRYKMGIKDLSLKKLKP